MIFWKRSKPTRLPIIIFFISIVLLVGMGFGAYRWVRTLSPLDIIEQPFVQRAIEARVGPEANAYLSLLPELAGLREPVTYLLLFLNNTEIRPGGGFIGVYAVVTVTNGVPTIHVVEGTEILDGNTPESWKPVPPTILTEDLKVDRWFFRDSNWSPDFAESAKKAMELYKGEEGIYAENIDIVAGVTPTVLEELLAMVGPITVDGHTFDAETVTEKLEYEVEYGYRDRGIAKADRKAIIQPLMQALKDRVESQIFTKTKEFVALGERMAAEKHILVYAVDPELQKKFSELGVGGEVVVPSGDSLQWVDANLAALKTDYALERTLSYEIQKAEDGGYQATVTMTYNHTGSFDWRTSRYLSYTRVYAPLGATLISTGGTLGGTQIDTGLELGKSWFGTSIRIEPGNTETLSFTYKVPDLIAAQIESGLYTLLIQKQLGTTAHGLTIDLNFGTTIIAASPAEVQEEWYDTSYRIETDLSIDRAFQVTL